ncbi:MAG: sucrase ferredoxin [Chloroflexota bacterium]
MSNPTADTKTYCNCLAEERGLAPQGHAGSFQDAVLIETPLPWKRGLFQEANPLPQEMIDLLQRWLAHYQETGEYGHRPLVIAPDEAYSHAGQRRVIFYTRPDGLFARYEKQEYLVPEEHVGALLEVWYGDQAALSDFDSYRVPDADAMRDILVCTHGTVDVACAKFGYPLYKHLRDNHTDESLRVWRVSHFGGHVFAPTLMDMPTGHYWGYLTEDAASQIMRRAGDVKALSGHYRGWAGAQHGFQQAAEHALWQIHSWDWFGTPRAAETISQDDDTENPQWADVRVRYLTPKTLNEHVHEVRVDVSHTVATPPSTDHEKEYPYPQYRVRDGESEISQVAS